MRLLQIILISLGVLASIFSASAETVSRKEAQNLAAEFFSKAFNRNVARPNFVYNGKQLALDRLFTPFYVFNNPSGGYVIVAADNKAFPILGFSLTDSFDPTKLSDGQKGLLAGYAQEIEYIRLDDRIPTEAIAAWGDLYSYFTNILKSRSLDYEPKFTPNQGRERIYAIAESFDSDSFSSAIYSPEQWQAAVNDELKDNGGVALGFPAYKNFPTALIHGRKGDYYRINFDGINNSYFRLGATEFINSPQLASLGQPIEIKETIEIEKPFEFYDSFIAEQREEARNQARKSMEKEFPSEPQIRNNGAGHYDISFPENVVMARVYNLSGAQVAMFTYSPSSYIHLDISSHPLGFYFVVANGADGKPFGLKLVR